VKATIVVVLTLAVAAPAVADEYVYFSELPGVCFVPIGSIEDQTTHIYVHAPDVQSTGVAFRLVLGGNIGPEDLVSTAAADGVQILGGDILTGIVLSWAPGAMDHASVLDLVFTDNPPLDVRITESSGLLDGTITTSNIVLLTSGGSQPIDDFVMDICCVIDCFDWNAWFTGPNAIDVAIGETTEFGVVAYLEGSYIAGAFAADDRGWVTPLGPEVIQPNCPVCPWSGVPITLTVNVPAGVAPGTESNGRVWIDGGIGDEGGLDFSLRAVEPVATEPATWGDLKAKYLKKNE
jgi:hypothetical protein